MSLAKPQNVQEDTAIHIDKFTAQVSIAISQVHREAAKRLISTLPPVKTEESLVKKPRMANDFGPHPQIKTK